MARKNLFAGLDQDLQIALRAQLRDLWTHTSTALEGNSLTLGDTAFILAEGLTVAGKPLKDHYEVVGHARAIELLYHWIERTTPLVESDLFQLHRAVQTEVIVDIYSPVGAWKNEPNGTYYIDPHNRQAWREYAQPKHVPALMGDWLASLNQTLTGDLDRDAALTAYTRLHLAFTRIHPFFDGNGRMARLIANLPLLQSGFPPIVVARERRREYIKLLVAYDSAHGQAQLGQPLLEEGSELQTLEGFFADNWQETQDLLENMRQIQHHRSQNKEQSIQEPK
ncbi:MAG: Fic family protein [Candidatus Competibacteraceae bacterium]|nr:MAG: Fic family protein [Candidatus Competibacteraceae bacterium]